MYSEHLLGISIHGCHLLKVLKIYGCQATVLKGSRKNLRVPLHRSSKFYGCQAPVAPVLTRALLFLLNYISKPFNSWQKIREWTFHSLPAFLCTSPGYHKIVNNIFFFNLLCRICLLSIAWPLDIISTAHHTSWNQAQKW